MESDLTIQRINKVKELIEQGINPYSNDFKPANNTSDLVNKYSGHDGEKLKSLEDEFSIAGRVISIRDFGKSAFFHVKDASGKIQCFIQKNQIGEERIKFFKKFIDIGDFVGVTGKLFKTKTKELTLNTIDIVIITKSLKTLPEKWHGLKDVELRYRQRYLDLISNEDVKQIFLNRSKIIKLFRSFMDENGYIEVETPILHPIAGGAAAKPFKTHHNALDMELYLRIAPELYLKRLVVGGIERVYEIGRTFRNEGISTQHNPEFTMIEFYQSYSTYTDLMDFIENLIIHVTKEVVGSLEIEYVGTKIDMSAPWQRINIMESLKETLTEKEFGSETALFKKADSMGLEHNNIRGKALMEIFESVTAEKLINPAFVYGFPLDVSPLARKNDSDPTITDRFELFIAGKEIANAFSELNDPQDQKQRFENQIEQKSKGEEEYHEMDLDYVHCLEYGMPPTAGAGIGIDRLVMLLTNSPSIREVLLFPHLRPE
ncbi:MAG: lysine--tRNA ligase [Candidatus Dadabacteria bacterium]|nr:lysine--tRNA ligase [Candidatus Dadabacteria bacterium]NIS09132.1 lysine--tRNA ligase [Candidatus Dadabacteria bacterium]NIV43264.1 lysine--tRNA ligase [Candidatus Dadabacteria bacterium]NIX15710.1 lysine--tRNA ligase [Candidatus Dadabacteria bacterium]NIY22440.1 lysine--tRNA ligase [Candidatus Dadabacteria bacterium]